MNNLNVFNYNGAEVIDSREVAEMISKNHKDLLRDIRGYIEIMKTANEDDFIKRKIAPNEFFIPSEYKDSIGRTLPCYLLTKKGCDMVANKLTGEKGVLFTAAYVTAFETMRQAIHATPEVSPGGVASLIRVMRRVMLDVGNSPLDVEHMAVGLCQTWRVPLPEKVVHHISDQVNLWDAGMLPADEN